MKIIYDKKLIIGKYDKRNLTISNTGKNKYPSKKMLIEFLKKYKDIKGVANIWDERDIFNKRVIIYLEIRYNPYKKVNK